MLCSEAKRLGKSLSQEYVADPLLLQYDVHFYHLDLELENNSVDVEGTVAVHAHVVAQELDSFLLELVPEMEVSATRVDGQAVGHARQGDKLLVLLDQAATQGQAIVVEVDYAGTAPQEGFFSGLSTGYEDDWQKNVTWSLSEPFSTKDWWPSKQVLSDKADSAAIWITTSAQNMAGSNGILEEVVMLGDTRARYEWRTRYPIAYYLISVAVADYQEYNIMAEIEGLDEPLLVQNFVYDHPDYLAQNQQQISYIDDMLSHFSEHYGLYPFSEEKYGHCLAPMGGGMEHQTMTTQANFGYSLTAHELAHQWFGDHVTCGSWQDIWINEGFASYSEYLSIHEILGPEMARQWLSTAHNYARQQVGSVYVPLADATDVNRIFDYRLTYKKGASILHVLRKEVGDDELYFQVFRTFLDRHAQDVATGEDFKAVLEELAGRSFEDFFQQWYYGQGHPQFEAIWNQDGQQVNIQVNQQGSSTQTPFFKVPLDIELRLADGSSLRQEFRLEHSGQVFEMEAGQQVSSVSLDPDAWLLCEVNSISQGPTSSRELAAPRFGIFPNPASGQAELLFEQDGLRQLRAIDLAGRVLLEMEVSGTHSRLDLTGWPAGVYLLESSDAKGIFRQKLIVE